MKSQRARILTQFLKEARIIEVAGEPGDRWLRLRNGGVKPPLQS